MMKTRTALHTDLYQLTMAAGYFQKGMHEREVSFELFVRRLPKNRRYLVFAGLEAVLDHLRELRFTESQIDYLRHMPALRPAMTYELVEFLRGFRFRGDVWAMPEGTVAFAREPLIRVSGTLLEAQLVETYLLSAVNSQTAVASKAARVVQAAAGHEVMEFGSRRTSPEEAVDSARAAFLAGFAGTSNVEAGYLYDVPVAGTAAHSWTMAHVSEQKAFEDYIDVFSAERSTLLVDTYDTLEGVDNAIRAAKGRPLGGVRLDSGNLPELSRAARAKLDAAGLTDTKIIATGDLNETQIASLLSQEAPIDVFGVGTELVRSTDSPHLGGVYKLVHDHTADRPVAKTSVGKETLPGLHQVYRVHRGGRISEDVLGTLDEFHVGAESLLVPWMKDGELIRNLPGLADIRKTCREQVAALPEEVRDLSGTEPGDTTYPVQVSNALSMLVEEVRRRDAASKEGS